MRRNLSPVSPGGGKSGQHEDGERKDTGDDICLKGRDMNGDYAMEEINFLVLIKQVPDEGRRVGLDETGRPDIFKIDQRGNSFDRDALEMAATYKEKHGGKE